MDNNKSVELVTHCYAIEHPHYAALLNYQLSSLLLYPPKVKVTITICHVMADKATQKVIQYFCGLPYLNIKTIGLTHTEIGRRSIGRNMAAKATEADVIWFTDVDHFFVGCLDGIVEIDWPKHATMVYPREINIHKTHELGDLAVIRATGIVKMWNIHRDHFMPKRYRRAIGGVQIVEGGFARDHGYLGMFDKWQKSTDTPFKDFRDDIAFRNYCLRFGNIIPIELPGVYRLRHSKTTHRR